MKTNEKRIWNKSELEQMEGWSVSTYGSWFNDKCSHVICEYMVSKSVEWCKDNNYIVEDEMIAKTETELVQEAVTQANEKLKERLDNGEIGITLLNGTILKVGEIYKMNSWKNNEYIKILAIGKTKIFVIDDTEQEDTWDINLEYEFIPYTEPKEEPKPLEGYQKWYEKYDNGLMQVCYSKLRPVNINITYYTEQEAIELGLNLK